MATLWVVLKEGELLDNVLRTTKEAAVICEKGEDGIAVAPVSFGLPQIIRDLDDLDCPAASEVVAEDSTKAS